MPTLIQIRQYAAQKAGRFAAGTVDASGNSTSTVVAAAIKSTVPADNIYADYWLYLPAAAAADKVRTVASSTAATGTLTVDRVYSGSSVPNSKAFELHGVARPFADDLTEGADWTSCINAALKRCWVVREITITPTADAIRHDVSTANTWLTNPDWVKQVGVLSSTDTRANIDPYSGSRSQRGYAEAVGSTIYLNHQPRTYDHSTQVLYVKAIGRAYDFCRATGGAFGDQSGLALESDEAVPLLEHVTAAALVEMADRQGKSLAESGDSSLLDRRKEWAAKFTYYARKEMASLPELTFSPRMGLRLRHGRRGH